MDNLIFCLSKILWLIFSPVHFVVILFLISVFFIRSGALKQFIQGLAALFFLVALILPIGEWALLPLEQCSVDTAPPMRVDGVLVLGGAVDIQISTARNAIAFNDAGERVLALLKLIRQYPNAQFVYAGGSNSLKRTQLGEADYISRFLSEMGMKPTTMVFESQSRNTYEDAFYSKEVYTRIPHQNWLLVTSAFHMPRTLGLFQKMGEASQTQFYPYTVDYKTPGVFKFELRFDMLQNLQRLDKAAHEYVGLLVNQLQRRSNSFMPCSQVSSQRMRSMS
ncbi:MAG: YdcF family protein [Alphaproteobacteria bacterium]|nr:YdcF family protein [Alphaproteobacteria bacterium]